MVKQATAADTEVENIDGYYSDDKIQLVVDAIRTHHKYSWHEGLTFQQVATQMGLSYHGARLYLLAAERKGKVERIPSAGRQQFWRLPDGSKMPTYSFNPKPRSPKIPINSAALAFAAGKQNFKFLDELPAFPLVIAQFYDISARVATGSKIPKNEFMELKMVLQRLQAYARNLVVVTQEMLDDKRLWDAHSLTEALLMDPNDPITVDTARNIAEALHKTYDEPSGL